MNSPRPKTSSSSPTSCAAPSTRAAAAGVLSLTHRVGDPLNSSRGDRIKRDLVLGLIAGRGPAFTACTLAELGSIASAYDSLEWLEPDRFRLVDVVVLWHVRRLLAYGAQDEYDRAKERLAAHRRTRSQQLIASYLLPTRHDWVDECCARPPADRWGDGRAQRWLLWNSLGTARHVELLSEWPLEEFDFAPFSVGDRATMAEGVGPAIAPVLVGALDRLRLDRNWRDPLVQLISVLPSDEAFGMLLERGHRRVVRPHLLAAMERFPVRAVRVLSRAAAEDTRTALLATSLLNLHLAAHPELTAAPSAAARVPEAEPHEVPEELAGPGRIPKLPAYADPDGLPQVLLRDRTRALPADAVRRLVALARKPDERLPALRTACDPASLADLGWALFQHGDAWALVALGWLGDDRTVRDLVPLILDWPREDGHALAVKGLDVLVRIGTPDAAAALERIARESPYKALKRKAQEKREEL